MTTYHISSKTGAKRLHLHFAELLGVKNPLPIGAYMGDNYCQILETVSPILVTLYQMIKGAEFLEEKQ